MCFNTKNNTTLIIEADCKSINDDMMCFPYSTNKRESIL